MSTGNISTQADYLYSTRWPKEAVDLLIGVISVESLYGGEWEYKRNMKNGLMKAKQILELEFATKYSDGELKEALAKLYARFMVWKNLRNDPRVFISKWNNKVKATSSVWNELVQEDSRVKWYAFDGENVFDDLEVIFANPYKGKDDYVFLGEVSGLHIIAKSDNNTRYLTNQSTRYNNSNTNQVLAGNDDLNPPNPSTSHFNDSFEKVRAKFQRSG